jgi:CRP/FNR family transcriptional regulator
MTSCSSWLDSFPPLRRLPAALQADLAAGSRVVELPAGSRIFRPGQGPENFLLVLDGVVRVSQVSEGGREIVLYRVAAGESCTLTTACLVGEEEYQADGVAETAVRAVAVPRRLFDAMVAGSGEFRRFVFAAFGRRLTSLLRVIEDVAFARIEVRLAQRLLLLDDGTGRIAATHQELANELGSAREVVSRQLTEWKRRGLIRSQRGVVEIADRAAVARLASVT